MLLLYFTGVVIPGGNFGGLSTFPKDPTRKKKKAVALDDDEIIAATALLRACYPFGKTSTAQAVKP
jgi:hypothetical protein